MHKRNDFLHKSRLCLLRGMWYPRPWAFKLFIGGLSLLFCGVADIAWRMYLDVSMGAVGCMLKYTYDIECIFAGMAILTGGVLLLDAMERGITCRE